MQAEGGCYCGAVRYAIDGEPMLKAQCHCRECQYITGGAPNMFMAVPPDAFKYTKGTPKHLKRPVTREFCAECGTHLVTRPNRPIVEASDLDHDDPKVNDTPTTAIYT